MKDNFLQKLSQSIENETFVKLTLAKPIQKTDLKNIYVRLIGVKKQPHLSFTFRYNTRDEVKNLPITEGGAFVSEQLGTVFLNAILFTTESDFTLNLNPKGEGKMTQHAPQNTEGGITTHDTAKNRQLDPTKPYFHALDITDKQGKLTASGQKKFRQIDKYMGIVASLLRETTLPDDAIIADFGSGKGYLTFALYDFLKNTLQKTPSVFGIELRQNLVDFCNNLAEKSQFTQLEFVAKDINDFHTDRLDMLIALHACDIATDLALAKGIHAGAKIIVVAPCCHKQIRNELRESNVDNELSPLLKNGILEERQAELLTDGLRALLLEKSGYRTKVFEFISTEHTPKNVMIVGIKSQVNPKAAAQIDAIKTHFGIKTHFLETLI
jgi:SAM-dependent methyltransferase